MGLGVGVGGGGGGGGTRGRGNMSSEDSSVPFGMFMACFFAMLCCTFSGVEVAPDWLFL